jgi:SAM-dependent methyltransferase
MQKENKGLSFNLDSTIKMWQEKNRVKKPVMLNLGSGGYEKKGWINHDQTKSKDVQVVHDLNRFPYPFKNESIDVIYMSHVLEHLDNPVKVLNELHRIIKKSGLIIIRVPHYSGNSSWIDITHSRPYSALTLRSVNDAKWCRLYGLKKFTKVESRLGFWKRWFYPWNYIIEPLANLQVIYYEAVFANIFPPFEAIYIIEK